MFYSQPDSHLSQDRVHELYNLLLFNHDDFQSIYSTYLGKGLDIFDLSLGVISKINDEEYQILAIQPGFAGLTPGIRLALKDTYCAMVVQENTVVSFDHIGLHPVMKEHPAYKSSLLESYIAAPIWVNGEIYGTLNFTSRLPRISPFTKQDQEFISLMAQGLGSMIERDLLHQEKQQAVDHMLESAALFESAFQNALIGMALVAPDGRWYKVNQSLVNLLGYEEDKLLALDFQSITHPDDLATDLEVMQDMAVGKRTTCQMEKRYIRQNGEILWSLLSVSAVHNEDGSIKYFVSQIQNISERRRAEALLREKQSELTAANARLAYQATRDSLTGVANRRKFIAYFNEEMVRMSRQPAPISLVMIDIDNFKSFNDEFGHLEGDRALCRVAQQLEAGKRQQDKLARFGGEEFTLLLPATDGAGCFALCEQLRLQIAGLNDLARPLTISLGCMTFVPLDERRPTLDEMIRLADGCLYEAKRNGRNQVCHRYFTP